MHGTGSNIKKNTSSLFSKIHKLSVGFLSTTQNSQRFCERLYRVLIEIRRLEWTGHIIRMEEERIPKEVLNGNLHTTRPVERPRTRWADVVHRDALQLLGTRGWRRRAANRDEWRRLMREAKARKGL
jgi:hypothetical protein